LPKVLPIISPLLVAIAMAVIFRHPAMLMFGLIGPFLALSGHWGRKRELAKQARQQEVDEQEKKNQVLHEQLLTVDSWRNQQLHEHPAVTDWLHNPLWRAADNCLDVSVRLGRGVVTPPQGSGIFQPVTDAPVAIPLHTSLAVVGSGSDAMATWRAVFCQALSIIAPSRQSRAVQVSVSRLWAQNADVPTTLDIPDPSGSHSNRWCFVDTASQVPPHATWVLVVAGREIARLFHRGVATHDGFQPDALTFAQSRWVRARLVDADGAQEADAPDIQVSNRGELWAELSGDHPAIDLVSEGPHALVWGKTGSGKSVLVQTLVTSLLARYSPERFALVGIDFKGGASLAPLMVHPHGAGLLTDLNPSATFRVAASLRAEILHREQLFADNQVASWQDLPDDVPCPRVLIVVDEAGVVANEAPELMAVLSDIASRGRSLGLHLLMSTQRPQQLPRNIVANCALRLCLSVTDADEASHFAPDIPGHLLASLRHSPPGTVAIPRRNGTYTLTTVTTDNPVVSWSGHQRRQLWCDELPGMVTAETIASTSSRRDVSYLVGVADYPDRQSQEAWEYLPATHGPLVIVGESGSGHTTCLTQLASSANLNGVEVVWGSSHPSVFAWQLLSFREKSADTGPQLFLIDRLDRTLQGVPPDGQAWIIDGLETLALQLSERGDGSSAVVTTAPGHGVASGLSRWNATRLLLRHRDATQWALAGGTSALHDPLAPPGRAVVGEVAMQWCHPGAITFPDSAIAGVGRIPEGVFLITAQKHRTSGVIVLTPQEAESRWQEVKHAIDRGVGVVLCDISAQQMRQWCGPGHNTPPVAASWPYGWHLHPGGVTLVTCEVTGP